MLEKQVRPTTTKLSGGLVQQYRIDLTKRVAAPGAEKTFGISGLHRHQLLV